MGYSGVLMGHHGEDRLWAVTNPGGQDSIGAENIQRNRCRNATGYKSQTVTEGECLKSCWDDHSHSIQRGN